jgi:hypothetical protein
MNPILSAGEIIDAFGGPLSLAVAIGRDSKTVARWRQRGIPAHEFGAVAKEAKRRRLQGITHRALVLHHAPQAVRRTEGLRALGLMARPAEQVGA